MSEPRYHIQEADDKRCELHEQGAGAPITIKDTLDEAIAWVTRIEPDCYHEDPPDHSGYHSSEDVS